MPQIKLVSYNLDHSSQRQKLGENIKKFAAAGANIFCLQEVRAVKGEAFIGDYLLQILGPGWDGRFIVSFESRNDNGVGIIWNGSVMQPLDFHDLSLPLLPKLSRFERLFEWVASGEARPVKRSALIGTFKFQDRTFRVSNAHLDWQGKFGQRFRQLEHLVRHLKSDPVVNEIVCGDLNTLGLFGNTRQIKKIQSLLGPDFINFFPEFRVTTSHHQQLDHVFARNFMPGPSDILRMPGSDHFPIMTTLDFVSD